MKHRISAPPGSEEFRLAFRAIRDEFLAKLDENLKGVQVVAFRACDTNAVPIPWVWDNEAFRNEHHVGSFSDAKSFAANMIDQGMRFAFLGAKCGLGIEVWLTTWESPDEGPNWPPDLVSVFEEVHEGVSIG